MSVRSGLLGLERLARSLPAGVDLYQLRPDGRVLIADRDGARELGPDRAHGAAGEELLRFIDEGQFAHYLVGDAKTSPERPSNATYKLGIVAPHSAFTPHAHGGEHLVLSLGHAACGLYDAERRRVVDVPLTPGLLIRIPELMPHSFANRGSGPLNILAANTGFGIDHEDYAITAAEAERRADDQLAAALREVERNQRAGTVSPRERLAARLRRFAATLETPR
ncbi:cupin domain-containing protein [Kitasatospora sp. NPDC003701]